MNLKDKIIAPVILLLTIIAISVIFVTLVPPGDQHNPPGHTLGRHMLR